ncbi:hypothetical protein [uncultured Desulfuromusa sp.]|uniref:PKD domain-containing protein n=1 Tax=uncultured Desulfuromusa sp. TaxID=219183 RepID=UPI002AA93FF1|nr:hypothetical protein [uncultured Desulfuromusa sp.]
MSGSVTDDGLPSAGVQIDWQQLSGPGSALFTDPNSAITDVTFDTVGTYELELVVDDGEYLSSDSVTVTVTAPDTEAPLDTSEPFRYWPFRNRDQPDLESLQ